MTDGIFKIEATSDTPLFQLDRNTGSILIKGVSMPENAFEFFDPLEKEALAFAEGYPGELKVEIQISYLNSMSGKQLLKLIKMLASKKPSVSVVWKHAKG